MKGTLKLREWILDGAVDQNGNNIKVYTSPYADKAYAIAKLEFMIPMDFRFCVNLKKGKIVTK